MVRCLLHVQAYCCFTLVKHDLNQFKTLCPIFRKFLHLVKSQYLRDRCLASLSNAMHFMELCDWLKYRTFRKRRKLF